LAACSLGHLVLRWTVRMHEQPFARAMSTNGMWTNCPACSMVRWFSGLIPRDGLPARRSEWNGRAF
jgi:hypothetical protein